MDIEYFNGSIHKKAPLFEAIYNSIDYSGGELELIDASCKALFKSLDIIVDMLHDKKILSDEDIIFIANSFIYSFGYNNKIVK